MPTAPITPHRLTRAGEVFFPAVAPTQAHPSRISANRAARERLSERTHGSLWEHGLLDRLSEPLTRYRE